MSTASTRSWGLGGGFSLEVLDLRPGMLVFRASGKRVRQAFEHEAGGHRFQRIPPTEKKGRVHTSTVTVAVLREPTKAEVDIDPRDLDIKTTRGSGAGGQHRNTTDSAVQLTHLPSGISVRCESERSQRQNKESALALLRARLLEKKEKDLISRENSKRKLQVGSGMRGDKRRTIRYQDGVVTDHVLNKKTQLKKYLRGDFSDISG